MEELRTKVAKGALWTLMEKISVHTLGFVIGVILAWSLTLTDYGVVALTPIFFAVAGVLVGGVFVAAGACVTRSFDAGRLMGAPAIDR